MTVNQVLDWMKTHRALLNLRGISSEIRLDYTMLTKAVNNKTDAYGYPVKFPERCLPKMIAVIASLSKPLVAPGD